MKKDILMNLNNHFYMDNIVFNNLLVVNIVNVDVKYIAINVTNIIGVMNVTIKIK